MQAVTSFEDSHETPAVRGFLHTPDEPTGHGLVLTHGAGSNAGAPLLIAIADAFCAAGIAVLRCDLPFRQVRPHGPPFPAMAAPDPRGLAHRHSGRLLRGGHCRASLRSAVPPGASARAALPCDGCAGPRRPCARGAPVAQHAARAAPWQGVSRRAFLWRAAIHDAGGGAARSRGWPAVALVSAASAAPQRRSADRAFCEALDACALRTWHARSVRLGR